MTAAIEVRERPILFSAEMVKAILEDRKFQTRRVIKGQPTPPCNCVVVTSDGQALFFQGTTVESPPAILTIRYRSRLMGSKTRFGENCTVSLFCVGNGEVRPIVKIING